MASPTLRHTSKQVADLVGVSIRTLRHYHQIGLLAEPERTSGGYRIYTPEHVLRLLRIKRLAGIGLTLDQIAEVLDHPASTQSTVILDELDRALADRSAEIRAQRRLIAEIRRAGAPIDVLPEFANRLAELRVAGADDDDLEATKAIIDLVAGLGDDIDAAQLASVFPTLAEGFHDPEILDIDRRLTELGPDASDQEMDELVSDAVATMTAYQVEHGLDDKDWSSQNLLPLMLAYFETQMTDGQAEVLRRIVEAFDARERPRSQTASSSSETS